MTPKMAIRLNPLLKSLFLNDFSVFGYLLLNAEHPFTQKINQIDLFDFKRALSVYEKFLHAADGEIIKLNLEEIFIEYAVIDLSSKAWLTDVAENCLAVQMPEIEPHLDKIRDTILRLNSRIVEMMKLILSTDPSFQKRVEQLEEVLPVE